MSEHISRKRVMYQIAGMDAVHVRRDLEFRAADGGVLTMDVYDPPGASSGAHAAVVIVAGYPDPGVERVIGCKFKEMQSSVCWARLIAASGMVAITYTNREPAADFRALLDAVRIDATSLAVDENRIALWSSSGNAPVAMAALMRDSPHRVICGALCYPYTLDLDGATAVSDAAATFRFVNACAGKSIHDLRPDTPLLLARAGRDETPRLNETLDRFVHEALRSNLPITVVNHASGPHAFDLDDDSSTTRHVIRQVLDFLRFQTASE